MLTPQSASFPVVHPHEIPTPTCPCLAINGFAGLAKTLAIEPLPPRPSPHAHLPYHNCLGTWKRPPFVSRTQAPT